MAFNIPKSIFQDFFCKKTKRRLNISYNQDDGANNPISVILSFTMRSTIVRQHEKGSHSRIGRDPYKI